MLTFATSVLTGTVIDYPKVNIKVGHTCSCTSCGTVETMTLETYAKRVLPAEWISTWHAESLKAGAIAVRSYGAYRALYAKVGGETYDVCDTTCCQVCGTYTYTSTNSAVDITKNIFIKSKFSNKIVQPQYSAEANNSGCGDGKTATCISDPLCAGTTNNGHGNGMCQWGSQRRALAGQSYNIILAAYYPTGTFVVEYLAPVSTLIKDNTAGTFVGNWSTGTSATDKYGADYRYCSTAVGGTNTCMWNFSYPANIVVGVTAWWPAGTNRTNSAKFIMPDGTVVKANQKVNGGKWNFLKSSIAPTAATVKISNDATAGFVVIADGIRLVPQ